MPFVCYTGDQRLISCTAPAFVQFTVFDDPEEKYLYLNIVNVQEFENIISFPAFTCSLDLPYEITGVELLPDEITVEMKHNNGYVEFIIDKLDIYKMYRLAYTDRR